MYILLTDAAPTGPQCAAALAGLRLPTLEALLRLLNPAVLQRGSANDLTPLNERLRAQAAGLVAPDGLLPWAALDAQQQQLPACAEDAGWGWITPCHWRVHADHVTMSDPATLQLLPEESDALLQAMRSYFAEDGLTLHPYQSGTWLACGATLRDLPTASLQRVSGRSVDPWLGRQAQARSLRRLQNEMQMLLYTHPVNAAREARGLLAINSFWISGTGHLNSPRNAPPTDLRVIDALRQPNLNDDANTWRSSWDALERGPLAEALAAARQGTQVTFILCGENSAQSFDSAGRTLWSRLRQSWRHVPATVLMNSL